MSASSPSQKLQTATKTIMKLQKELADQKCFPTAREGLEQSISTFSSPQTQSPSYQLAFAGNDFLLRSDMQHARLLLEFQKCDLVLKEQQINHTFVVFGSARLKSPSEALIEYEKVKSLFELGKATIQQVNIKKSMLENSKYYEEARMFGEMVAEFSDFLICTGGGPGCMAAACKGAFEKGAKTIGMNIVLPFEQTPNPFITPELSFNFHYFSVRKMHLLARAKGLVVFPGGFGTLDELFEAITLVQTRKMKSIPIILVGVSFWNSLLNFDHLVNSGFISPEDVHVFSIVETAVEAWERILHFYETK